MRAYVLFIAFSVLFYPFPARSQQPLVGSIQGVIKDQHQAPIPYAALTATNVDSVEPASTRLATGADQKGIYQFVDVPPGRYSIVVKMSGYRDYTVRLVTVRPGETVKMPVIKMSSAAAH
jgi:hypothetical protein